MKIYLSISMSTKQRRKMKAKYIFIVVLAVLLILASVSFVLALAVEDVDHFDRAAAGFILTIIFGLQHKYALKPPNTKYGINPVKSYYHKKGDPQTYRDICIVVVVISLLTGTVEFVRAIIAVL